MSWLIGVVGIALFLFVGMFVYAMMKVASDADDFMEAANWSDHYWTEADEEARKSIS